MTSTGTCLSKHFVIGEIIIVIITLSVGIKSFPIFTQNWSVSCSNFEILTVEYSLIYQFISTDVPNTGLNLDILSVWTHEFLSFLQMAKSVMSQYGWYTTFLRSFSLSQYLAWWWQPFWYCYAKLLCTTSFKQNSKWLVCLFTYKVERIQKVGGENLICIFMYDFAYFA